MAIKTKLPKTENGYELGADRYGYFSIVAPEERTINYIKNACFNTDSPPFAYRATGNGTQPCDLFYTLENASASPKDRPMSITGAGAKIAPAVIDMPSMSIYYTTGMMPAGTYTFSAYYSGEVSNEFLLQVFNSGQTIQYGETARSYGSGLNGFQRLHLTFTIPTGMVLELKLSQLADSLGNLSPFYTDMWQLEDKPYVTLPFLGHAMQYSHDNYDGAYSWWGTSYYSESVRTDRAYESGREVDLSELGFRLTGIVGLGINPINHVINDIASGGGVYSSTADGTRTFTLVGRIYGKDMQDILTKHRDLYELLRPKGRNIQDQPTTLLFRIWDCEKKNWVGQPIYIYCRYTSGLEGAIDSETSEDIAITFTSEDPYVYSSYIKHYEVPPYQTYYQLAADTAHVSPIFTIKDKDNTWEQLDMRLSGPTPYNYQPPYWSDGMGLCVVKDILPDGTGGYFVHGTFTDVVLGGVSTTVNSIFRYNHITKSVSALGAGATKGVAGGEILKVIVVPSGDAIVVGNFASAGGVANTNCIALYKPGANTWHSISSGITAFGGYGPEIKDVEYGDDNKIYVCGTFETIDGVDLGGIECMARMDLSTGVWEGIPIARTQYFYPAWGMNFIRLYRQRYVPGYKYRPASGFISGAISTFATPYTSYFVWWNGSETFYTWWRANGDWGVNTPINPFIPMQTGVINQNTGSIYVTDGNNKIYKVDFTVPPYEQTSPSPGVFITTYTHPERNGPSIWTNLNPPFSRKVWAEINPGDYQQVPLSTIYVSELKMIDSRLVLSPAYSYGLDCYEVEADGLTPVNKHVPLIWYHHTWSGAPGESSGMFYPYSIYATSYAYQAAFHVSFATGEAFIAVNPGHIIPEQEPPVSDNIINATVYGYVSIINNGENTPFDFRIVGPASIKGLSNHTSSQELHVDGYQVAPYDLARIVTLPRYGSEMGLGMHRHILDNSDMNLKLVPGKNIMSSDVDDIDPLLSEVSVIFRERYASIAKAIEYVGG